MHDVVIRELPSVGELVEFAIMPTEAEKPGQYEELIAALRADPDGALDRFLALLQWPKANVRAWACSAGASVCGRKIIPALRGLFADPSQEVQESVVDGIEDIDPGELRPLLPMMRKRLLTWDGPGAGRMARLLTMLDDKDSVPFLKRYAERSDIDLVDRARAGNYASYLEDGLPSILDRIRNHQDHLRMAGLCKLAFAVGAPEVRPAFEQLATTAPDERCRMIGAQALGALDTALAAAPPPYWNRRLDYSGLPRP